MPLPKPVALVTGANKGIGFEVARGIATAGYVVLLGARNPTTGLEAANILTSERLDVRFVELDVTRMETISAAAVRIEADFGRILLLTARRCRPPRRTAPSPCTRESSPPEPRGLCPCASARNAWSDCACSQVSLGSVGLLQGAFEIPKDAELRENRSR